jgi:hypothetical protein
MQSGAVSAPQIGDCFARRPGARPIDRLRPSVGRRVPPTDSRGDASGRRFEQLKAPLCGAFMGRAGLEPAFFGLSVTCQAWRPGLLRTYSVPGRVLTCSEFSAVREMFREAVSLLLGSYQGPPSSSPPLLLSRGRRRQLSQRRRCCSSSAAGAPRTVTRALASGWKRARGARRRLLAGSHGSRPDQCPAFGESGSGLPNRKSPALGGRQRHRPPPSRYSSGGLSRRRTAGSPPPRRAQSLWAARPAAARAAGRAADGLHPGAVGAVREGAEQTRSRPARRALLRLRSRRARVWLRRLLRAAVRRGSGRRGW